MLVAAVGYSHDFLPKVDYFPLLLLWIFQRTCCGNVMDSLIRRRTFQKSTKLIWTLMFINIRMFWQLIAWPIYYKCFQVIIWDIIVHVYFTFYRNFILVRADISRLPFATSSIDAVHAGAALHCWPSPSAAVSIFLKWFISLLYIAYIHCLG